jgi:hypothetical protein
MNQPCLQMRSGVTGYAVDARVYSQGFSGKSFGWTSLLAAPLTPCSPVSLVCFHQGVDV